MKTKFEKCREDENRTQFQAPGLIGKGFLVDNACRMETTHSINGSGQNAFGGAEKWPTITTQISFQEGQEKERDEFAAKLREFIENHFNKG